MDKFRVIELFGGIGACSAALKKVFRERERDK